MIVNNKKNALNALRSAVPKLFYFIIIGTLAAVLTSYFEFKFLILSSDYIKIQLSATGVFLAFRINSAYGRWWEARQVFGGLVTTCRSTSMCLLSTIPSDSDKNKKLLKELIRGIIGFSHVLRLYLRKQDYGEAKKWFEKEDIEKLLQKKILPTQLVELQIRKMSTFFKDKPELEIRYVHLLNEYKELLEAQGKCERIKNTTFPWGYAFYTRVFTWYLAVILPFYLVTSLDIQNILLCSFSSYVLITIEKVGRNLDNPFENSFNDTPMTSLCTIIEVDLLEMMNEKDIPELKKPVKGALF